MARDVVEVVVRFGDTILDVAYVDPQDTYRIGTAPGVNLAVPGHTSFPLVDAGKVRCPVGVPARNDAATTELQLAQVTVQLTRRKLQRTPVARPRPQWRAPAFVLGSLLVHLCVWLLAVTLEPFEPLVVKHQPRFRYAHVADVPEPPPPEPPKPPVIEPVVEKRKTSQRALAAAMQPPRAERVGDGDMHASVARTAARVADSVANTKVVERVSALREEDNFTEGDEYTSGFGGRSRFPPGETIKAGDYQVMLYDVKLCPAKSCTVSGPVPASYIRPQLHAHMTAIYTCYQEHASGPGTIVLEFTIAGDGSVRRARGHGLGETGACAARVLPQIYFKAIGDNDVPEGQPKETRVRYPIRFN